MPYDDETKMEKEIIMEKCRQPTKEEREEIKKYFLGLGQDEETAEENCNNYWFAVFDRYISDCPSYSGKLMVAVYGDPSFYEVFIWNREGLLERVALDDGFFKIKSNCCYNNGRSAKWKKNK